MEKPKAGELEEDQATIQGHQRREWGRAGLSLWWTSDLGRKEGWDEEEGGVPGRDPGSGRLGGGP